MAKRRYKVRKEQLEKEIGNPDIYEAERLLNLS